MKIIQVILLYLLSCKAQNFEKCLNSSGISITPAICLPEDYKSGKLPENPLIIEPSITFVLRDFDELSMAMTLMLWINLNWIDPNLYGNHQKMNSEHLDHLKEEFHAKIWRPDLHYQDLVKLEQIEGEEIFTQVDQENNVEISMTTHVQITTSCKLDFRKGAFINHVDIWSKKLT